MARLIPEELPVDSPASEGVVFQAARSLPDGWTVLWDVPVGLFGRRKADLRQIDCLLLHERLGIIVLEVKGGDIKVEQGEWFTRPRGQLEWKKLPRSPFEQVADQRFTLQRFLTDRLRVPRDAFCHAVALPGVDVLKDMGPDSPRELALDAGDLVNFTSAIHRVRQHWGNSSPLGQEALENVVNLLRPSFTLTVLSSTRAAQSGLDLERETSRQALMVTSQLEAYRTLLSSDRVIVLGGAGTGKTVLAAKLAEQLSRTGTRALLLCHRTGVQSFLHTLLGIRSTDRVFDPTATSGLHLSAWSRLVHAVALKAGQTSVSNFDARGLAQLFFDFREHLSSPYGALVIDEGQEFTERQVDAVKWLLEDPDSSPIYIFADPFQHSGLFSTTPRDRADKGVTYRWSPPIQGETVVLTVNCRNTNPIGALAGKFYPESAPLPVVDGPEPIFHNAPASRVLRTAFQIVRNLTTTEGFRPNQVLVVNIGDTAKDADKAAQQERVPVVALDQLYRYPLTPKDLRIAHGSPDEAQGLESDAVVVTYAGASSPGVQGALREMYIATTRARSVLHVVSAFELHDIVLREPDVTTS